MLTQEVSYESLLAHQRKSLHEAIGGAIERHHPERLDEQAALLAHHYSRAEAWREAVHYGRRAAERAGGLSQFADAFDALDKVLEWLPHLPDDEERRHLKPTCCSSRSARARRWGSGGASSRSSDG